MLLFLYRSLIILCTPFIRLHIAARVRSGKEDPARVGERYGVSNCTLKPPIDPSPCQGKGRVGETQPKLPLIILKQYSRLFLSSVSFQKWRGLFLPNLPHPALPLSGGGDHTGFSARFSPLWIHAASVGEATAALTIATLARDIDPTLPILITTGTVTSADLIAKRLPPNAVHQYAPFDHPVWVARFLDNWAPCANIRIESELWPNMCRALQKRHIPTMLCNAHLSDRSFARWRMFPRTARTVLAPFTHIFADGDDNAARYVSLGAAHVTALPSLKFIADPLPVDLTAHAAFDAALAGRPVWIYASTHWDEELLAARVHGDLKQQFPNLLTLIALRHPARAARILSMLAALPFKTEQRSRAHIPENDTDLYVIDTIGELGMFFKSTPIAMIGRSFSLDGGGGHNPIEPTLFGCLPLSGPAVQNLTTIYDPMVASGVVDMVKTPGALSDHIAHLLTDIVTTTSRGNAAREFVLSKQETLKSTLRTAIINLLEESSSILISVQK